MAYYVNKTDGTAIYVLDGTKDTTSTSLTLIGRLATNYGEVQNENVLHLLENFALGTSPAYPITGQLWYDTTTQNLKVYNPDGDWDTVGSIINGNVDLSGNLFIGPNNFRIQDINGNVTLTNFTSNANISIYSNVGGTQTQSLIINGTSGLVEVVSNATSGMGITTKSYVDHLVDTSSSGANVALAANVVVINANLAARVLAENSLRANIEAANVEIALRDTITRVNSINSAIDTAITSNVSVIDANLVARIDQIKAVETQMLANINLVNNSLSLALGINNQGDIAANIALLSAQSNIANLQIQVDALTVSTSNDLTTGLSSKAPINSPTFTGTPAAPTPTTSDNSTKLATTAFVKSREPYWDGRQLHVSTLDPTSSDGAEGDIWLKYT
jgi:hypothetical protein